MLCLDKMLRGIRKWGWKAWKVERNIRVPQKGMKNVISKFRNEMRVKLYRKTCFSIEIIIELINVALDLRDKRWSQTFR